MSPTPPQNRRPYILTAGAALALWLCADPSAYAQSDSPTVEGIQRSDITTATPRRITPAATQTRQQALRKTHTSQPATTSTPQHKAASSAPATTQPQKNTTSPAPQEPASTTPSPSSATATATATKAPQRTTATAQTTSKATPTPTQRKAPSRNATQSSTPKPAPAPAAAPAEKKPTKPEQGNTAPSALSSRTSTSSPRTQTSAESTVRRTAEPTNNRVNAFTGKTDDSAQKSSAATEQSRQAAVISPSENHPTNVAPAPQIETPTNSASPTSPTLSESEDQQDEVTSRRKQREAQR
ncbi:Uncharacterised protein [Dermatophilus congolensis]|uniref:Uncharacterized protein n=1 Tax=Dermatophilus congolensis TaxID=1863 RepID=A0AA46H125_9MICO|nr:Uncharacterised protein [Dermatophilus congolensis]